jgi:GTP-binding protein
MEINKSDYVKSAVKEVDYAGELGWEFAFVGKSNVGKSSLINSISNRRSLAKVSKTPGRTQLINFFIMNEKFYFVDLPGYGFAKLPPEIKKGWGEMIENYLKSPRKKTVFLLLDLRRTPGEDEDNLMEWLRFYNIPFKIIFTKVDKLSNNERANCFKEIKKRLNITREEVIYYSSHTREGRETALAYIESVLAGAEAGNGTQEKAEALQEG